MKEKATVKRRYIIIARFNSEMGENEVKSGMEYIETVNLFEKALKEIFVKSGKTEGKIEQCFQQEKGEADFNVIFPRD